MKRYRLPFIIVLLVLFAPAVVTAQDLSTGLDVASEDLLRASRPAGAPAELVEAGGSRDRPGTVDLSSLFPVPGDQGPIGSCGPWSVAYAAKTYLERVERGWDQNDPSNQFSPSFLYNLVNEGRDVGSSFSSLFSVLLTRGVATLETMPYTTDLRAQPSEEAYREAAAFRARSYYRLDPDQREAIRVNLAAGNPVLFGMNVSRQFMNHRGGTFRDTRAANLGGHAMCLVGYDDGRRAYKLINSWGTRWGDGGFAWIDYDTFEALTNEVWVLEDRVEPTADKVLPPRDVRAGEGESTRWVAVSWLSPGEEQRQGERYRVYRADLAEERFSSIGETSERAFRDEEALPGVEYLYAVSTLRDGTESELSSVAVGRRAELDQPPGVPRDLTGVYRDGRVELSWTGVDSAEYYEVLRLSENGYFYGHGASADALFVDTSPPGTPSAQYSVRAVNRFGTGDLAWAVTVDLVEAVADPPGASEPEKHADFTDQSGDGSSSDDRPVQPGEEQRVRPGDRARDFFDPAAIQAYFEEARRQEEEAFRRYRQEEEEAFGERQQSEEDAFQQFLEEQRRR